MLGALLVTCLWRRHKAGKGHKKKKKQPRPPSLWRSLLLHHSYIQLFLPCKVECVISHSFLICSHMMNLLFLVAAMAAGFYGPNVSETYQWATAVVALLLVVLVAQPLSSLFYWKTTDDFVLQESLKYLSSAEALSVAQQQSRSRTTSNGGSVLRSNGASGNPASASVTHSLDNNSTSDKARAPMDLEDDKVFTSTENARRVEETEKEKEMRQLVASLAMYNPNKSVSGQLGAPLERSMAALDDIQLEGGTTTFGSSTDHSSSAGVGTLTFGTTDSNTGLTGTDTGTGTVGSQQPAEEVAIRSSTAGCPGATTGAPSFEKGHREDAATESGEGGESSPADTHKGRRSSYDKFSGGGGELVAARIEVAEAKLLKGYRSMGHSTNGVLIVLTAICTYMIIATSLSSAVDTYRGTFSSCDFFVFSVWKAILLDIFCAQPAAMLAVLGYRWVVSNNVEDDSSSSDDEQEEETRTERLGIQVTAILHP